MRAKLLIFALISLLLGDLAQAQTFTTGNIGATLRTYGRLRIFAPDENTRQIDRLNILVLDQQGNVFDFAQDANDVVAPVSINNPQKSDFEIYAAYDNTYSNLPPDVSIKQNVYGWSNQGYVISRYVVKNTSSTVLRAKIGFEFLPQVDNTYGNESVRYNSEKNVVAIFRAPSSVYTAVKILSSQMITLQAFEWFTGYNKDSLYNVYLSKNEIMSSYDATSEGSVVIIAQDMISIPAGDSTIVYLAIACGADESQMKNNFEAAVAKYNNVFTSVKNENNAVRNFELYQNFPNPFNPNTKISFALPKSVAEASIKIYNSLGAEVRRITLNNLSAGIHSIDFNAADLTSGVYFYKLEAGEFVQTKKMILMK